MDFVQARNRMVDGQVRTGDVTDLRIIGAMLELPRERFVPSDQTALAYADLDLPLAGEPGRPGGRCLVRPRTLAKLLQTAEGAPTDRVLGVGCATGYGAAGLSRPAGQGVAHAGGTARAAFA